MGSFPNSEISAPAMKVLPSHMIIIASVSLSLLALVIPLYNPSLTVADRAFTGGEFRVIIEIFSSFSIVVTSFIEVIFFPFTNRKYVYANQSQ